MSELQNKKQSITIDRKRDDADYKLIQRKSSYLENTCTIFWSYTTFDKTQSATSSLSNEIEYSAGGCDACGACGGCGGCRGA
jgi:hypothetical protein